MMVARGKRSAAIKDRADLAEGPETKNTNSFQLEQLYRRYRAEIFRYVRSQFGLGPPDPEDVVQATFANFATQKDVDVVENPRAFLYRAAHNIAVSQRRKLSTQALYVAAQKQEDKASTVVEISPERELLARQELKTLEQAIQQLPKRDRTFLLLNRLENVPFAEIGRRTGMTGAGVRLIVKNALEACHKAIRQAELQREAQSQLSLHKEMSDDKSKT